MAKGQHLTPYQRGIVKRYYENKDTLMTQKLGDIVSDLYVCTDEKKARRLWKSARTALINAGVHENRAAKITEARDLDKLAEILNELF